MSRGSPAIKHDRVLHVADVDERADELAQRLVAAGGRAGGAFGEPREQRDLDARADRVAMSGRAGRRRGAQG